MLLPEEFDNVDYTYVYICTDYVLSGEMYQILIDNGIDAGKIRFLNRIGVLENWTYEAENDRSIISTIGRIKIREQFRTDFDILYEVFVNNTYKFNLPYKDSIVIDVGMNVGIASLYFANIDYVSKVYGFEPFPDTYAQALGNFELNDMQIKEKIIPHNVALSDKDEIKTIAVNAKETGWRSIFSEENDKEHIQVECKGASGVIHDIISQNKGKRIIMKMDTEGSEFPIFRSLKDSDCLDGIDVILMEYHGDSTEIIDILNEKKFKSFSVGLEKRIGMIYAVK